MNMKLNKGFTLVEVIIYIALFSLILGSGVVTAFGIIDGAERLHDRATSSEEGSFVMKKFDYLFSDLHPIFLPSVGGTPCAQNLILSRSSAPQNPVVISLSTTSIQMKERTGSFPVPLTSQNVKVTCLEFKVLPSIGSKPHGIYAKATIDGTDYSITKYLRK